MRPTPVEFRAWVERPLRFNSVTSNTDDGETGQPVRRSDRRGWAVARIIAIEDSPALQRLLALTMRGTDIEIEAHLLGQSGLDAALENPPNLIILDLGLPDIAGWDVLERLRAEPATAHIPILVATGQTRSGVVERISSMGAVVLEKPFTGAVLRATVRVLIDANVEVGSPT